MSVLHSFLYVEKKTVAEFLTSLGESQFLSSGSSAGEEKLQEMVHLYRVNKSFNEEVKSWFSSLCTGICIQSWNTLKHWNLEVIGFLKWQVN